MGKIFCLLGKSSCGKDTIFKKITENKENDLIPIVPYTTRPIRSNECDGREYHFITEEQFEEYLEKGLVIERRVYNTVKGKWYYGTIDDGQINLNKGNYMMITTLESYNELRKYFEEDEVVALYINVDDGIRLERALTRERSQVNPNYKEMCRRFIADSEDFSEENLRNSGITHIYENNVLEECIEKIENDIKSLK